MVKNSQLEIIVSMKKNKVFCLHKSVLNNMSMLSTDLCKQKTFSNEELQK